MTFQESATESTYGERNLYKNNNRDNGDPIPRNHYVRYAQ